MIGSEPPAWGEPTIEVKAEADLAADAARSLAEALIAAVARRGRADWGTTGGSTPVPIYRHLTTSALRGRVPWDRVHVWWTDDRFVRRDDPLSNRRPFDEVMLGPKGVPLPEANVHGMPIDEAIEWGESAHSVAAGYEADLRAAPLQVDRAGFPVLDVVTVGVGPDGHVFSVFPGSPLFDSRAWVSAVPAPQHVEPHVARISMSPYVLSAAEVVLVTILGAAKSQIVAELLGRDRDPRRLPAQLARDRNARWFLDAGSAHELP